MRKSGGIIALIAGIGTFTMIFMILAAIGGILTLFGDKKEPL